MSENSFSRSALRSSCESSGGRGRRARRSVLNVEYAEDRADPVCRRAGDARAAGAAARRVVHSFECGQPASLQAEMLREQELLRRLEERLAASGAAAL